MDVFGVAVAAGGELMRAAAIDAGYELGIFDGTCAIRTKKLRALRDVLVAIGAIDHPPPRPNVPRDGWGRMAEVIRGNRALDVEGGEIELRYHEHLLRAGRAAAVALAAELPSGSLVDLGGGAGAYTRAYLEAHAGARSTLCDFHEVLALARRELGAFGDRVRFVSGDASCAPIGEGHDVALLANLLHLHGEAHCARLVAAAARAVRSGGVVAIKDLTIDDARTAPIESLLFALNMAIYTGDGDVYTPSQLRAWLASAGLVDIRPIAIDDGMCWVGSKP